MMRASPSFSAAAGLLAIVALVAEPALANPVRRQNSNGDGYDFGEYGCLEQCATLDDDDALEKCIEACGYGPDGDAGFTVLPSISPVTRGFLETGQPTGEPTGGPGAEAVPTSGGAGFTAPSSIEPVTGDFFETGQPTGGPGAEIGAAGEPEHEHEPEPESDFETRSGTAPPHGDPDHATDHNGPAAGAGDAAQCTTQCATQFQLDGDQAKYQTCAIGCSTAGLETAFAGAGDAIQCATQCATQFQLDGDAAKAQACSAGCGVDVSQSAGGGYGSDGGDDDDDGPPACIAQQYTASIGNRDPVLDDCPTLLKLYLGACPASDRAEISSFVDGFCKNPLTAADISFGGAVEYAFQDPFCQFVQPPDSSRRQRRAGHSGTEECIAQCQAFATAGDLAKAQTCATECTTAAFETAFAGVPGAGGAAQCATQCATQFQLDGDQAKYQTCATGCAGAISQSAGGRGGAVSQPAGGGGGVVSQSAGGYGAEFEAGLAGAGDAIQCATQCATQFQLDGDAVKAQACTAGCGVDVSQSAGGGDDDDGPPECIAQQYASRVGDRDPEKADCPVLKSLNLGGCGAADKAEINFFVGLFCAEATKATYAGDGTSCGSHTIEDGSQVYFFVARFGLQEGGYCHSADAKACGKALANFKTDPNNDPSAFDASVTCIMAGQEECVFDPEIGGFARITFARNQVVEARISAIDVDELVSAIGTGDEFTFDAVTAAIQAEVGFDVDLDDLIRQVLAEKAITQLEREIASLQDGAPGKAQKQAELASKKQAAGQSVSLGSSGGAAAAPVAAAAPAGSITLTKDELIALIASLQKDSAGGKEASAQLEKTDPKFKAQNDLRAAQAELERVNNDPTSTQAQKDAAAATVAAANNQQAAAAAGGTAGSPAASVTVSVASAVAAVLLAALC